LFDILRGARLLNGTFPVRLIGFASEENPPTVSWSGLGAKKMVRLDRGSEVRYV
jgi:hypothetical protein